MGLGLPYEALCEPTVAIGQFSAPEPDVAIFKPTTGDGFFPAELIMLVVEVSVTSLKTDLNFKKALCAEAQIPEYWVFEVESWRIHQFWKPVDRRYAESRIFEKEEIIASASISGIQIAIAGLL